MEAVTTRASHEMNLKAVLAEKGRYFTAVTKEEIQNARNFVLLPEILLQKNNRMISNNFRKNTSKAKTLNCYNAANNSWFWTKTLLKNAIFVTNATPFQAMV